MSLFDTGIIPAINQHLADEAEKVRDYGDYWSASSAGYCHRKQIFERLGIPPVEEDARKQRVFSSGHVFHEWIQKITKDAGLSIAQELELQDEELMIRGHVDDLVLIEKEGESFGPLSDNMDMPAMPPTQHLILYDYKTAHSKWFEYVKTRPVSYYNKMQVGTYMYMVRRKGMRERSDFADLTEARILKISKDDLRLFEYQVLWAPELENEIKAYWQGLKVAWGIYSASGLLPPCTCHEQEINKKTGKGFMADPRFNPFFYESEPCSQAWFELNKVKEKGSGRQSSRWPKGP